MYTLYCTHLLSKTDLSKTLCRSVRPFLAEELDIDWGAAYLFLFPDGNILHGSWTSYAIVALAIAIVYELGMQILYLFVRVSDAILTSPECGQELFTTILLPHEPLQPLDIKEHGKARIFMDCVSCACMSWKGID